MIIQNKKIVLTILICFLTLLTYFYSNNEKINSKAYITNQADNTVSVVDLVTLEVVKTIKVGIAPLGITILNKKNLGFIGNVGSDDISVIDTRTDQIIKTIKLNTAPLSLTSNPDESKVYVTDWFKNNILIIGGRIKKIKKHTGGNRFLLTYGDGVADININKLIGSHEISKKICTVTSVQPLGRFGAMVISKKNEVLKFQEKPNGDGMWINAGFMVCEQEVFDYIDGDETIFEQSPLEGLAIDNKMNAYKHKGFWKAMDTLKDKNDLNDLWIKGMPKWKTWSR